MAFESLSEKLNAAFKKLRGKGRLSPADVKDAMREVRMALLEADVSYKVVKDFIKKVTERAVGADVLESLTPAQMIVKIVNEELTALMGSDNQKIRMASQPPTIVMMVGLQGAGKTTHTGKLAGLFKKQGKNPLLVACDIYRPAAIKQLQIVGSQVGVPVFEMGQTNPVDVAKAAIAHAVRHGNDMVFLDTAGRLHVDEALMEELKAIKAAVKPNEILLVVDAMTGQDAVNAAQTFNEYLDIDGVILSKLDGDARGGAALSVKAVTGKPIKFIGMGSLEDLAGMMPGMNAGALKGATVDEKAMARTEAIIQSMTPYERENPSVLNHSRKRRIAAGSGVKVEDINRLLKQFDMMNQLAKQFSGPGAQKKMKRMGKKGGFGGFPGFPGM